MTLREQLEAAEVGSVWIDKPQDNYMPFMAIKAVYGNKCYWQSTDDDLYSDDDLLDHDEEYTDTRTWGYLIPPSVLATCKVAQDEG